jgi:hypothetical protein
MKPFELVINTSMRRRPHHSCQYQIDASFMELRVFERRSIGITDVQLHTRILPRHRSMTGTSMPCRPRSTPAHSITSSAVESSVGGTARPSILAVSALITSSNLLDCTTGKSAGFAPLRMRPV